MQFIIIITPFINQSILQLLNSVNQSIHQYIHFLMLIIDVDPFSSLPFILLYRNCGPYLAFFVFLYSLQFVAKSGEVWCEGGRIFLNPCSSLFSLANAKTCLNLAIFFTPQYGDSFIEVRLN